MITLKCFKNSTCKCCETFKQKLEQFEREHPQTKVIYLDAETYFEELKQYDFKGLPFTVVLDDKGNTLGTIQGDMIYKRFKSKVIAMQKPT